MVTHATSVNPSRLYFLPGGGGGGGGMVSGAQRKLCAVHLNNTLAQFTITRRHSTIALGTQSAAWLRSVAVFHSWKSNDIAKPENRRYIFFLL